jgi:hypothetical protein
VFLFLRRWKRSQRLRMAIIATAATAMPAFPPVARPFFLREDDEPPIDEVPGDDEPPEEDPLPVLVLILAGALVAVLARALVLPAGTDTTVLPVGVDAVVVSTPPTALWLVTATVEAAVEVAEEK